MAKRKRSKVKTIHCKLMKVSTGGKFDKVKIGSRFYRTKSGVLDIHPGSKTKVCPMGKSTYKTATTTGKLEKLYKVPKRR